MSKVNLKDNIYIEGFNSIESLYVRSTDICIDLGNFSILYEGKTSEIPEELVEECVIQFCLCKGTQIDDGSILQEDIYFGFKNYKPGFGVVDFETPKESIQSACDEEYCIIYKIK